MLKGKRKGAGKGNGANLGFEEKLWQGGNSTLMKESHAWRIAIE